MAEENIGFELLADPKEEPSEPKKTQQLSCICGVIMTYAGVSKPLMLQQLRYKPPAAAGKENAVATAGHFMGKMFEKMHVGRMADVNEDVQCKRISKH